MTLPTSRRGFLRASAYGAGAPLALGLGAAPAAAAGDYRALVCLYLSGGNDHLSMVVPHDTTSYNLYQSTRGGLALARSALLPLPAASAQGGRAVALNPALVKTKALYDAGRCAVLANVGPLLAPTTQAEVSGGRVALPPQLGSHNDQSNTWQSLGTSAPYGWGGLLGDALAAQNIKANFTTISANGGYARFLVGDRTNFFTVSESGAPSLFFGNGEGSPVGDRLVQPALYTNLLEQAYAQVHERLKIGIGDLRSALLPESALPGVPAGNAVNSMMQSMARVMGGRQALGIKRQIFFLDIGGFDTHSGQTGRHSSLMSQLDVAIDYFDRLMGALGLRDQVTLFTTSEFGRSYSSNGDGTDHAWGSHHLLVGAAVKGGNVYGRLPDMARSGPDFLDGNMMIPTTSVEQYGATLAKWMGVGSSDMGRIFPRLGRFASSDLGFLNA